MIELKVAEVGWAEQRPALSAIRRAVFIEEQQVPEALEWDGCDAAARHVLAWVDDTPVATGRLLASGHIGRMAVLAEFRGQGVGTAVLRLLLTLARTAGLAQVFLNAQLQAADFYRAHGFISDGESFLDAGIAHVSMRSHLGAATLSPKSNGVVK